MQTSSFVFSCIAFLSFDSVSFNFNFVFSRSFLILSFSLATEEDDKHDNSFWRLWMWERNSDASISWFLVSSCPENKHVKQQIPKKYNTNENENKNEINSQLMPVLNFQHFDLILLSDCEDPWIHCWEAANIGTNSNQVTFTNGW